MPPYRPQLGHIPREQQGLLHCVGNVIDLSSLEVLDGGIGYKRGPIHHLGKEPSRRFGLRITPPLNTLLPYFSLFGRSLGLIFLGGVGFPSFHHFLAFRLPFPFVIDRLGLEG